MKPPSASPSELHDLLTDPGFELTSARAIVRLLAAIGSLPAGEGVPEGCMRWVLERARWLPSPSHLAADLDRHAGAVLGAPSSAGLEAHGRWLRAIEALALARRGADRLGARIGFARAAGEALARRLIEADALLDAIPWLWQHARDAAAARAALGEDILPWSKVRGQHLGEGAIDAEAAVSAWMEGRLSEGDAGALSARVRAAGSPWQEAYRQALKSLGASVDVVQWSARWSPDVARDEVDLGDAERLLAVPLPHIGPGVELDVRSHEGGLWWRDPTRPSHESGGSLVPFSTRELQWGDDVTGSITTRIRVHAAPPLDEVWRGICAARQIGQGLRGERALTAALALARDLRHGHLHAGMKRAWELFESGEDPDEETIHWASYALDARLALDVAAEVIEHGALHEELSSADQALNSYANGILILPDEVRDSIVGTAPVDGGAWWGRWARGPLQEADVDRALKIWGKAPRDAPQPDVAPQPLWAAASEDAVKLIDELGSCPPEDRAHCFQCAFDELKALPCAWLRHDIGSALLRLRERLAGSRDEWRATALAEAAAAVPGRVALLVYDRAANTGHVLELRVELPRGTARPRALPSSLDPEAIRIAFNAASAMLPSGLPPHHLDEHIIELVGAGSRRIDGRSVELPAALAFASLWLRQSVRPGVAATGELRLGPKGAELSPVGGVAAKARALAVWAAGTSAGLLVHPRSSADVALGGVEPLPVNTLSEAFQRAGLDASGATVAPTWGGVAERVRDLVGFCEDVEAQRVKLHAVPRMDPWLVMADRMRLLVRFLVSAGASALVPDRARVLAALAFTHAGDEEGTGEMLAGVDAGASPAVRLLALIVELGYLIDRGEWGETARLCDEVTRILDDLPVADRTLVLGKVLGAQGRVWLHQRDVEKALPLLRRAAEAHALTAPWETGRSRVYVATALRMAGRYEEAMLELEQAARDLETHTRRFSESYLEGCLIYWSYERARLLVEMDRPAEAVAHAQAALDEAEQRGFWPKLGILRTLAWAFRLAGREDDAAACVARMKALESPDPARGIVDAMVDEASGWPIRSGLVY